MFTIILVILGLPFPESTIGFKVNIPLEKCLVECRLESICNLLNETTMDFSSKQTEKIKGHFREFSDNYYKLANPK